MNNKLEDFNITSLPNELIELISLYLDMDSFLNLRICSKLMKAYLATKLEERLVKRDGAQLALAYGGDFSLLHKDATVSEFKRDKVDDLEVSLYKRRRLNLEEIVQTFANDAQSYYLDQKGQVWFRGLYGGTMVEYEKIDASPKLLLSNIKQILGNKLFVVFLKNDCTLLALNADITENIQPVKDIKNISQVIADPENGLFLLKEDSSVWYVPLQMGFFSQGHCFTIHPRRIDIDDVKQVFAGYDNFFFLCNDNSLWGCGFNGNGELGQGHCDAIEIPMPLTNLAGICQVACGPGYSLFLTVEGDVLVSGKNKSINSILGKSVTEPTKIPPLKNIKQLAICNNLALFLTEAGELLSIKKLTVIGPHNQADPSIFLTQDKQIQKIFSSKLGFFNQFNDASHLFSSLKISTEEVGQERRCDVMQ